jgi:hypothetical protein
MRPPAKFLAAASEKRGRHRIARSELSEGRALPRVRTSIPAAEKELSAAERQEAESFLKLIGPPRIGRPYNQLPAELQAARLWVLAQPKHDTADGFYMGEEFADLYAARQKREYPLRDIPLAVLLPTLEAGSTPPGISAAEWTRFNDEKRQQKLDFVKLSRNSKLIVAATPGCVLNRARPAWSRETSRCGSRNLSAPACSRAARSAC